MIMNVRSHGIAVFLVALTMALSATVLLSDASVAEDGDGSRIYGTGFSDTLKVTYNGTYLELEPEVHNAGILVSVYVDGNKVTDASLLERFAVKCELGLDTEHTVVIDGAYPAISTITAHKQYQIKFVNYDDKELQTGWCDEGTSPEYVGSTPTKPSDASYRYTFKAWEPAIEKATKTATYKAQFDSSPVGPVPTTEYTVTIKANDASFGTVSTTTLKVNSGTKWSSNGNVLTIGSTSVTATPSAKTAEFTYTLKSWSPSSGTVSGNTVITAMFEKTVNKYEVVLDFDESKGTVSYNGSVCKDGDKITAEYGKDLSFAFAAKSGYGIHDVVVNGNSEGPDTTSCSISKIAANCTLDVEFTEIYCDHEQKDSSLAVAGVSGNLRYDAIVKTVRKAVVESEWNIPWDSYEGQDAIAYDISISTKSGEPAFKGKITVNINVGTEHNGKTVTVFHNHDGKTDTVTATVVDGIVSMEVENLSPFMVMIPTGSDEPSDDKDNTLIYVAIAIVVIIALAAVAYFVMRKKE